MCFGSCYLRGPFPSFSFGNDSNIHFGEEKKPRARVRQREKCKVRRRAKLDNDATLTGGDEEMIGWFSCVVRGATVDCPILEEGSK